LRAITNTQYPILNIQYPISNIQDSSVRRDWGLGIENWLLPMAADPAFACRSLPSRAVPRNNQYSISNTQYPILNIQYPISKTHLRVGIGDWALKIGYFPWLPIPQFACHICAS
jgi:hypothetical protein